MSQDFGPFSVNPAQVVGLSGALFQSLVSRLLAAETASAGMAGSALHTSYQENVGDQGVDAGVYSAKQTVWIPEGDSAWQFKAGDLGPEACASELEGAKRARAIIERGGSYRIVLGKALEDYKINDRETKLRDKAVELGYDISGDRFKVIDGNQLARWVEQFPQLAVSTLLRGIGNVAIPFDKWHQSVMHQSIWVPSTDRDELHDTIRALLAEQDRLELRIEGVSGLGKTRGVMEALRGSPYEPLVLYVGDADALDYALIDHLTNQDRSAVVVLDECTRKRHDVFAQQLQRGARVKIITIGERDTRVTQSLPIVLSPLPDAVIEKVLEQYKPALWPEARRVVVANCAGNVKWAMYVAEAILGDPTINVGSLVDASTLQLLIGDLLSGDAGFLALSALALFTRYGVDREMRSELEQIGDGLGIPVDELLAASRKLERLGLVTQHGRYRSVTPQPLAVFLATRAWEEVGERILTDLFPVLSEALAEQLLLRAADLGSSGPASIALNRILGPGGPFGSLESMTDARASRLLIQLAIVSPDEVAKHMTGLITKASPDQLRQFKSIRRDLVGALEKLVWHSTTFEVAADTLLRLALSENETWSNNATGTWLGLFSPLLPATAAKPAQRMAYLERVSTHSDPEVRLITAKGAHAAIGVRGGAVMVSGELQGGVVVEPRGTPQTYDELWAYLRSGILLLQAMVGDPDRVIRATAEQALIDSIHPMLEIEAVRDTLFDALTMLPEDAMRKVRTQIRHLEALFRNVEKADFKSATDSEPDVEGRRAGLAILQARLPEPAPVDELTSLAFAQRWEWEEGELQTTISEVAFSLPKQEAIALITVLLSGAEPPEASFELGVTLYSMAAGDETAASLAELAETSNVAGLVGYLHASATDGHSDVFDVFLDGPVGSQLDPATRLVVTVRGPQSPAGWSRLLSLTKVLPVQVAAPRLFGWHRDVPESHLTAILDAWLTKVESQADYNFAIDVVAMIVSQRPEVSPEVEARISALVELRSRFPEVGQQSWDWAQMARRQLATDANALLPTLLTQVDAGWLHLYEGSDEKQLIQDTIAAAGVGSLDQVLGLVQAGSWRLQMDFRGWLADSYPAEDVVAWVSRDIGRARLVASLTQVAGEHPSTVVRYLLDEFGSDEEVSSSLYGDFTSGAWWGKESERLDGQISQLEGWAATPGELPGVRSWAVALIEPLMRRRASVLEAEAEGRQ